MHSLQKRLFGEGRFVIISASVYMNNICTIKHIVQMNVDASVNYLLNDLVNSYLKNYCTWLSIMSLRMYNKDWILWFYFFVNIRDVIVLSYSIRVPGWVLKCLNLITAPGSVGNQPGSVTWLATAGISKIHAVSWRNHIENQTTKGAQNM